VPGLARSARGVARPANGPVWVELVPGAGDWRAPCVVRVTGCAQYILLYMLRRLPWGVVGVVGLSLVSPWKCGGVGRVW